MKTGTPQHIPTALAGGISDRAAADHAFSLGADAIQVATRFVTTEECDADIRYKEAYVNAKESDIVIVKSPVGMPEGRSVTHLSGGWKQGSRSHTVPATAVSTNATRRPFPIALPTR